MTKFSLHILIALCGILLHSCSPGVEPCTNKAGANWEKTYHIISIRVNSEYVTLSKDSDTAYFTSENKAKFHWKTELALLLDSNLHVPFILDSVERIELYNYVEEIIANPPKIVGRLTDYAGDNVTIQVTHDQDYQKVRFGSLSAWRDFLPHANRIDSLTFQRGRSSKLKGVIW